jgi:acetoin utilization deacetylase AcuC-like enzyme
MIFYDPSFTMRFKDYGIMLPISPARAERVLKFLSKNFVLSTRGKTMPFPGPVFDTGLALSYLDENDNASIIIRGDLKRVHSPDFVAALYGDGLENALCTAYELIDKEGKPYRYKPERAVKPLTDLFKIIRAQTGGTYLACRLALAPGAGFCYYLGGGMHHARYDSGSGFCLINDIVIAARKIQEEGRTGLVWVIDLDAHKGDGTAELVRFARERKELAAPSQNGNGAPCILTLSIHMAQGWPLDKESLAAAKEGRAPLLPSDIDIGIEAGEEAEYTPRLAAGIGELEKMSAAIGGTPDLAIVVDGADPYEHDGLPSSAPLKLSLEQCLRRDNLVYRYLADRNIPQAWIQSGGYGERAWEPSAHFLSNIR